MAFVSVMGYLICIFILSILSMTPSDGEAPVLEFGECGMSYYYYYSHTYIEPEREYL